MEGTSGRGRLGPRCPELSPGLLGPSWVGRGNCLLSQGKMWVFCVLIVINKEAPMSP